MTNIKINVDDGSYEYQDYEGNKISPKCEKCGNLAHTCMMGKETQIWMCNDCLYGKQEELKFVFKTEFGGGPVRFLKPN